MSDCSAPRPDPDPSSENTEPAPLEQARILHERIGSLVKLERQVARDLAISLARMQREKLHRELGYARIGEYGDQALGISASKARQLAQLGRMLPDLPTLDRAMRSGVLGWTKARTLLPILNSDNEAAWVERALSVNSRELEDQAANAIRGDETPDGDDEFEPPRHVWTSIRLDAYHFERVMQATAEIRHHLGDADVSMSQCLLWMAERCLDGAMFADEHEQEQEQEHQHESEPVTHVCRGENAFAHNYRIIEHRCPACDKAWTEGRAGRVARWNVADGRRWRHSLQRAKNVGG